MNAIERLKAARAKLAAPNGWTKGCNARDCAGLGASSRSSDAVQFCAIGALCSLPFEDSHLDAQAALEMATPDGSVTAFNDAQEAVEPVLALFDRAIAKLEKEGK